jgi:hypothetical protein
MINHVKTGFHLRIRSELNYSGNRLAERKGKMKNQELAEKIATEILKIWNGPECTRAQLMLRQKDRPEKNMGGRNKSSIVGVVVELLDKYRG